MASTRRQLLHVGGLALPMAIAGCASIVSAPSRPEREVVDTAFERDGSGDASTLAEAARVAWSADDEQVIVTGAIWYGSPSCDEATLIGVTYDVTADRLTVEVGFRQQTPGPTPDSEGVRECTALLALAKYTVRVTFTGGLPEHVVVEQYHNGRDDTATTVKRSL